MFSLALDHSLDFTSYKLTNHRFDNILSIDTDNLRVGIEEILGIYSEYLHSPYTVEYPTYSVSSINSLLLAKEVL